MPFSARPTAPYRLDLALTYRCNLGCVHCYSREEQQDELGIEQWKKIIGEILELPEQTSLFAGKKNHLVARYKSEATLIAHAFSPGFETYATGWHSIIIQKLGQK